MPTTGPNYPASGATLANAGTSENANPWVNPGNIGSSSAVASITASSFDSPDISEILVASNFGFAVTGAVLGITVEISKRGYTSTNSGKDFRVQLATGTAFANLVGSNKATADVWPATTLATTTYGGSADTWTAGLTAAQVNATGFAVFVSAYANVANADIDVDWVRVTITTSEATSANATTATGTGAALTDKASIKASAGTGASTGAALAAIGRPGTRAQSGAAASTGAALVASASTADGSITFNATTATATASAIVARASLGASTGVAQGRSS